MGVPIDVQWLRVESTPLVTWLRVDRALASARGWRASRRSLCTAAVASAAVADQGAAVGFTERLRRIEEANSLDAAEGLLSDRARELHTRGFTVLGDKIDESDVRIAHHTTCHWFEVLVKELGENSIDVVEDTFAFKEVVHRNRLRYDLNMQATEEWRALEDKITKACMSLMREMQTLWRVCGFVASTRLGEALPPVRNIQSGVVLSKPGAANQRWHADGVGGLFSVFMPTVPTHHHGTQIWAGSHRRGEPDGGPLRASLRDGPRPESLYTPTLEPGSMLVYDYRVLHRGLANNVGERPMAYVTLSLEPCATDVRNFPDSLSSVFVGPYRRMRWRDIKSESPRAWWDQD